MMVRLVQYASRTYASTLPKSDAVFMAKSLPTVKVNSRSSTLSYNVPVLEVEAGQEQSVELAQNSNATQSNQEAETCQRQDMADQMVKAGSQDSRTKKDTNSDSTHANEQEKQDHRGGPAVANVATKVAVDDKKHRQQLVKLVTDFSGMEVPTQALDRFKVPHVLISALEYRDAARQFIWENFKPLEMRHDAWTEPAIKTETEVDLYMAMPTVLLPGQTRGSHGHKGKGHCGRSLHHENS